jgi:hypothetical protein
MLDKAEYENYQNLMQAIAKLEKSIKTKGKNENK